MQEALTNTLKHAGTVHADVVVRYAPGTIEIECIDGGGPGNSAGTANCGHGLAGMRERATLLGGEVIARPAPEGGFRVRAKLPL